MTEPQTVPIPPAGPRLEVRTGLARDLADASVLVGRVADDARDAQFHDDEQLAWFRSRLFAAREHLTACQATLHDLVFQVPRS